MNWSSVTIYVIYHFPEFPGGSHGDGAAVRWGALRPGGHRGVQPDRAAVQALHQVPPLQLPTLPIKSAGRSAWVCPTSTAAPWSTSTSRWSYLEGLTKFTPSFQPENIVVVENKSSQIKIVDFGTGSSFLYLLAIDGYRLTTGVMH